MDRQLLRSSVEVLSSLRAELYNSVEGSVIEKLDQVIFDLETIQQTNPDKITARDMLFLLGSVLEKLPIILEVIQILYNLINNTPIH